MRAADAAGSRDAPMTATACGASSGRIDVTVASAARRSAAATDVGRRTQRQLHGRSQPRSDFDRISKPGFVEHLEHRRVVGQRSSLRSARNPFAAAIAASRSSRIVPSPLPWNAIVDRERGLGRAVAEVEVRAHGDRTQLAVDLAQRDQRRLPRRVARVAEALDQRRRAARRGVKKRRRRDSGDSSWKKRRSAS